MEVHVPRSWSSNKNVVVVGTPRSVAIARKHIERILQQITGSDDEGAGEDGVTEKEEVEEEWMKEYMYRRS
jgi:hypothetical protein